MKYTEIGYKACVLAATFLILSSAVFMWDLIKNSIAARENRENVQAIEQYCVVEEKYTTSHFVGKVHTVRHCIDVYVSDAEELKDTITIPSSFYNEIEPGMEIKCIVTYTEDELVNIELADN